MNPQDEEFTLESILAEYKGISYIDGDKKTPKDVLDETARRIVQEETPPSADTRRTAAPIEEPAAFTEEFEEPEEPDEPEEPEEPEYPEIYVEEPEPVVAEESEPDADEIETYSSDDGDLDFFDSYRYSSPDPEEDIVRSVTEAIEREESEERERQKPGLFRPREERTVPRRREREEQEWQAITAPEPDYRDLARRYAARCNSLSTKAVAALVLSLIIALLTFLFEAGKALPLGLGRNAAVTGGVLLLLQLFVMLLGVETLVRGARDLATGGASADTLVFVSCIVTVFSGMYGMRSGGALLPYSAASALSLTFSLWGERMRMEALADTLRSASSAEDPHSVVSEYRHDLERTVLKKTMGRYHGFYSNLTQPDVSETAYSYAVPLILAFLVIITLYSALAHKDMSRIPGMFAALSAAAAAFTATLAFALPFRSAAKRAKLSGASIAGAGGADDIFYTDGCCITDEDLYPQDSLSVGDPQILKQVPKEKAIRYTASLIIASASCLAKVFSTILINEGMSLITTQDFVVSEGGVSGMIRGERVLTGNYAFMNLYSIRVPDELKLGNSVYTAVNGTLIAMFPVEYRPSAKVRDAILSILRRGVRLFLTVRDFNITPMTIEQKFKIQMDNFELLPIQSTYDLGDAERGGKGRGAAVFPRGGLPELGEMIASGRILKITSMISTIIAVASSVIGVLLMAVLIWSGTPAAARPGSLVLFMTAPLIVLLATEIVAGIIRR